jgi:hypothetical protein
VQPAQGKIGTREGVDAAHDSKEESERTKLLKIKVPIQIFTYMATVADAEADDGDDMINDDEGSRTELDSHANMPAVGRHAYIISDTGRMADVSPFTPDYAWMQLRIFDAAVQYDCPYSGQSYVLVIRNTLYVSSMKNNLLPPFVLRKAGIKLNDTPKSQVEVPTIEEHSMLFPETGFRIPLSLWGTFSYFPTCKPTATQMQDSDKIYMLTPDRFNPHGDSYAENEDNMLDWEGNVIEKKHRTKILLSEVEENEAMAASVQVSSLETREIDRVLETSYDEEEIVKPCYGTIPRVADQISSVLAAVLPLLDDVALYTQLSERLELGNYITSIGSTNATGKEYIVDDDDTQATDLSTDISDDDESDEENDDQLLDEIYEGSIRGEIDLDKYLVSATHAKRHGGVDASHLSKVWKIDVEAAKRTLGVTTQESQRTDNPKLSRNYGTNDRMLRYKRMHEYFFMDTLFATKKAGKSSRGHSCCQLFVTNKGFIYAVPMKSKLEVLQAVKEFPKEIGAPDAIICDAASEQKSKALRKFLGEIGTTLRVLEEGTPWANKAELYIVLIKEAVRKDMKDSNCPLAFWDYCVERRARINNLTAKPMFKLHGSNAHTATTGDDGDISNLCRCGYYEW